VSVVETETDGFSWMGGSGPRLISFSEAADILGVSEEKVQAWVDEGRIVTVRGGDGQQRVRLADEGHSGDGTYETGFSVIDCSTAPVGVRRIFRLS
jgi:excisionase family DNA binding protein